MQNLVFFIESTDKGSGSESTIGNWYMNRFTIDEDVGHEILKIYEVKALHPGHRPQTDEEREQKGMGHIIFLATLRVPPLIYLRAPELV